MAKGGDVQFWKRVFRMCCEKLRAICCVRDETLLVVVWRRVVEIMHLDGRAGVCRNFSCEVIIERSVCVLGYLSRVDHPGTFMRCGMMISRV